MNQTIIQRTLCAKNLKEAQKGLLFTGVLKIIVSIIIVTTGMIGYYYFGNSLYDDQDFIYPALIQMVLPLGMAGFFIRNISAAGAKVGLFFGLSFYIIFKGGYSFLHIWGIEFVLIMNIMFVVSYYYPRKIFVDKSDALKVEMKSWKYTNHLLVVLIVITIPIYILLGQA